MLIKIKNTEIKIPNWFLLVGAVMADNVYANHCKKKMYVKAVDAGIESKKEEEVEES